MSNRYLALPPIDVNQRYTIEEANAYLRQSNSKTYLEIATGVLPVIKDGKRTYVAGATIAARAQPPAPDKPPTLTHQGRAAPNQGRPAPVVRRKPGRPRKHAENVAG